MFSNAFGARIVLVIWAHFWAQWAGIGRILWRICLVRPAVCELIWVV